MKSKCILVLSLLLAFPLFAQRYERVVPHNLVQPLDYTTGSLLIPVVGSVAGGFGTHFRSEVHIINYSTVDQRLELRWIPQDVSGLNETPVVITLPPFTGLASEDFVQEIMQRSGLGSLLISPVDANGTASPNARLSATSRIWTRTPNSEGTVSQTFPSIPISGINASTRQIIPATLRKGFQYRFNVGLINLSGQPQRVTVTVSTVPVSDNIRQEFVVDMPPLSLRHISLPTDLQGRLQLFFFNELGSAATPLWVSYASNIDNITGDAWSFLGVNQP